MEITSFSLRQMTFSDLIFGGFVRLFVKKHRGRFPLYWVSWIKGPQSRPSLNTCSLIMMQEIHLNKLLFMIKVNYFSHLQKRSASQEEQQVSIPCNVLLLRLFSTPGEFNAREKRFSNIKNSPEHENSALHSHKLHCSNHINIKFCVPVVSFFLSHLSDSICS